MPEVTNLTAPGIARRHAAVRALEEPPVRGEPDAIRRRRAADSELAGLAADAGRARCAGRSRPTADAPNATRRPSTRFCARLPRRVLRLGARPRLPRPEDGEAATGPAAERRLPQHDGLLPRRRAALRADARRRASSAARRALARVRLHHRRPDAAVHELHLVRARRAAALHARRPSSTSPAPRTRTCTSEAKIDAAGRGLSGQGRARSGPSDVALEAIEDYFSDHLGEHPPRSSRRGWPRSRATSRRCWTFAERAYRRPLSTAERDDVARVLSHRCARRTG